MDPDTRLIALRHRLARKHKQVALLTLARDYAAGQAGHWNRTSDTGWLTSMVANAGGTLVAVLSGAEARQWGEKASAVQEQLTVALLDQRLLEIEIERLHNRGDA